jgi:phage repressor protein C with HTH and peptisase S24 domain
MTETGTLKTLDSRIRYIMSQLGLRSVLAASKAWNIPTSTLQGAMKSNRLRRTTAQLLANATGFSVEWIEHGGGVMKSGDQEPGKPDHPPGGAWKAGGPIGQPNPFRPQARSRKTIQKSPRERIHEVWRNSGIGTFTGFAELCGVTSDQLETIFEHNEINDTVAARIAANTDVEYDWIRHGTGPYRKRGAEASGLVGFDSPVAPLIVGTVAGASFPGASGTEFVTVPKACSRLSAGGGIFPEEELIEERYAFRLDWLRAIGAKPGRVVLLEVEGDSMSPVLEEGDTVLIDLDRTRFREGKLFAVAIGDGLFVKRLQMTIGTKGPQVRVISVNIEYHTFECSTEDITILGEVVWFGRTLI